MIDVHCHLNFKAFRKDYDEVIKRAVEAGVEKIINVGTKIDSSQKAVELAQKYENLYAIVGVHPHHADKVELGSNWILELEQLARQPASNAAGAKVVAIGEIGMDYYRYQSNGITDPQVQREIFIEQIKLAHKLNLPLQIHNRHAGKDILDILIHHKSLILNHNPGMFHCMSGDLEFLKQVLDLGFYIGFDGNITYKGIAPGETVELKELVKATPLDRIVIETDSPYLTPEPHRGSRNEPKYAIIVQEAVSKILGVTISQLEDQTTKNTKTLFGI